MRTAKIGPDPRLVSFVATELLGNSPHNPLRTAFQPPLERLHALKLLCTARMYMTF